MKWEGSLQGRAGTYQRILALQVIPLGVSNYLIIFLVVIIITVCVLPSLVCPQLLLLLPPLVLLRLPLPLSLSTVGRHYGWVLR